MIFSLSRVNNMGLDDVLCSRIALRKYDIVNHPLVVSGVILTFGKINRSRLKMIANVYVISDACKFLLKKSERKSEKG